MDGGDDPVEAREVLVGDVELAVRADVDLDPLQELERHERVQLVDPLALLLQPPVAQAVRVVADRVVRVPLLDRARDHRLERVAAVRPGRVRVQVAAQVAGLDQLRQPVAARGVELAEILAELGRDPVVAEERVDLLLGRERVDGAALGLGDPVLGDREPFRTAASRIATLCAFEPVKCWSRLP